MLCNILWCAKCILRCTIIVYCIVINLLKQLSGHCNMLESPKIKLKMSLNAHSFKHNSMKMLPLHFILYSTLHLDLLLCCLSLFVTIYLLANTSILSNEPCLDIQLCLIITLIVPWCMGLVHNNMCTSCLQTMLKILGWSTGQMIKTRCVIHASQTPGAKSKQKSTVVSS